jgi:hypothetical protein
MLSYFFEGGSVGEVKPPPVLPLGGGIKYKNIRR